MARDLFRVLVLFALTSAVNAQKSIPAPHVPPPTTSPDSPNTSVAAADPASPSRSGILYISGKIVVEDGSELPQNVVIDKVCGTRRSALGYADHRGGFSVKLSGSNIASLVDASEDTHGGQNVNPITGRPMGGSPLTGCELQAASPGYRSAAIDLGSIRSMDNPNVGTLIIRRIAHGGGTTVSQTMLTAPKNALKAYEQGMEAVRKGDTAAGAKHFEKAVALHPTFANAWYELGHLSLYDNTEAARADFDKALAADARFLPPYTDLAILAYRAKNWPETVTITDKGLRLDSTGSPELYYYNAAAQFNQKNLAEAEKSAREAVKTDFSHSIAKAPQLLSFILAARGDYAGAVEHMRSYVAGGLTPDEAERSAKQLAAFQSKADQMAKKQNR